MSIWPVNLKVGSDEAGIFHKISRLNDSRLAELLGREVLALFVRKELFSPEWELKLIPSNGWAAMIWKVYEFDPPGLSPMPGPDESHRLHYGLCCGGPDHRPSQVNVRGGEAASSPDRLSGASDGRRELGRVFIMIFSSCVWRAPGDFRLTWRRGRLPGCLVAVSSRP
jgi:hypothetical protein